MQNLVEKKLLRDLRHLKIELEEDEQRIKRLRVTDPYHPAVRMYAIQTSNYLDCCKLGLAYINTIPNSLTRRIFKLRYLDALSLRQVAQRIGGGNTAQNISLIISRQLAQPQQKNAFVQNDENEQT
jgi:hypothetical protein